MKKIFDFNFKDGVRFDMWAHGSTFIIAEFIIAAIVVTGVLAAVFINGLTKGFTPLNIVWLACFAGILANCITIAVTAIIIEKLEGKRPPPKTAVNPKLLAVQFTLLILLPFALVIIGFRQRGG